MNDNEWVRRGLLSGGQGLAAGILSLAGGIVAFVASVVSLSLIPAVGLGVLLLPVVMVAVRGLADLQRHLAGEWAGVPIQAPYRPPPPISRHFPINCWQRTRWILGDPATWRDLLWLPVNAVAGFVLGVLPLAAIVYGVEGIVVVPLVWSIAPGSYGYGPFWPTEQAWQAWLSVPIGFALLPLGCWLGPRLQRANALFSRSLLAPTRDELNRLLRQVTASRSEVVDAGAAELRRIERDLHDGAQARLVALGMNIGLAEQLLKDKPEMALELMAEARQASTQALAELRDLVRGIHPPVLAERGLDGGVRALVMALPLPVDVVIELPGRPEAPVESAAYFAVAEGLANVAKHSGATRAWLQIFHTGDRLRMLVGDDGTGGADPSRGTGLQGIERRLAAFDGTLAVTSPTGGPTVLTMELPCVLSSPKTSPSSGTD